MARNTKIWLYSGVPFDGQNVLSKSAVSRPDGVWAYIDKWKVHETDADLTYQRNDKYIRLSVTPAGRKPINSEFLRKCNYVCWLNPEREYSYMFGFITHIEYRNEGCAWIHFNVDYWHSYIDTIDKISGMITRQHYTNEMTFSRTALRVENVDIMETITYSQKDVLFENLKWIISAPLNPVDGQTWPGDQYILPVGNSMVPTTPNYMTNNIGALNAFFASVKNHPEAITGVVNFMHPDNQTITLDYPPSLGTQVQKPWSKCYKYPSMYIRVTDGLGNERKYYAEYFQKELRQLSSQPPTFEIQWSVAGGYPIVQCWPVWYKCVERSRNDRMIYDQFPRLQWVGDTFGQWQAQNGEATGIKLLGALAGILLAPATGGVSLAATVGLGADVISSTLTNAKAPDIIAGSTSYGGIANMAATDSYLTYGIPCPYFKFEVIGAQPGLMAANNEYWNMYGYKCGHVGDANVNGNPYWNYIQGDFTFQSGCPLDGKQEIKSMLQNGLRMWHTPPDEFGDYSLDNRA